MSYADGMQPAEVSGEAFTTERDPDTGDLLVTVYGQVVGVMVAAARYEWLIEEIENLRDKLSIYERGGEPIPLAQLGAELDALDAEEDLKGT